MSVLDEVIDVNEAADLLAIRPISAAAAMAQGRLAPARRIGGTHRGLWITTREAVARYAAQREIWRATHPTQRKRRQA